MMQIGLGKPIRAIVADDEVSRQSCVNETNANCAGYWELQTRIGMLAPDGKAFYFWVPLASGISENARASAFEAHNNTIASFACVNWNNK